MFETLKLPTAIYIVAFEGSSSMNSQTWGILGYIICLQHSVAILEVLGLVRKRSIELAATVVCGLVLNARRSLVAILFIIPQVLSH